MLKRKKCLSNQSGSRSFPYLFLTGFACYALMLQARQRSDTVVQEINEFDRVRFEKELTVTDLDTTFPRVWAYTPT